MKSKSQLDLMVWHKTIGFDRCCVTLREHWQVLKLGFMQNVVCLYRLRCNNQQSCLFLRAPHHGSPAAPQTHAGTPVSSVVASLSDGDKESMKASSLNISGRVPTPLLHRHRHLHRHPHCIVVVVHGEAMATTTTTTTITMTMKMTMRR